jgi:hypothetical protein
MMDSTLRHAQGSPRAPEIISFEPEHIAAIVGRDGEGARQIESGMELLRSCPYIAYSGAVGDKIIGAAGVSHLGNADGYAWVFLSADIERHKVWFHRAVKSYLRAIVATWNLRRVQAQALKCSKRNREWIEALGFKARPYIVYELEEE